MLVARNENSDLLVWVNHLAQNTGLGGLVQVVESMKDQISVSTLPVVWKSCARPIQKTFAVLALSQKPELAFDVVLALLSRSE